MKLVAGVLVGVLATFGFTIVGEFFLMNLRIKGTHLPFAELVVGCPLIALMAGSLIGLIAKERAKVAAGLGIAPWIIFLVLGTVRGHTTASRWLIVLAMGSIYLTIGIAASIFVGGRTVSSAIPNS